MHGKERGVVVECEGGEIGGDAVVSMVGPLFTYN